MSMRPSYTTYVKPGLVPISAAAECTLKNSVSNFLRIATDSIESSRKLTLSMYIEQYIDIL